MPAVTRTLVLSLAAAALLVGAAGADVRPRLLDREPAYSPDGGRIAFWRHVGGTRGWWLWTMRPDGRLLRRLARAASAPVSYGWSPDGRLIAYGDRREIFVVTASGGRPRRLTHAVREDDPEDVRFEAWRDARTIAYVSTICCTSGIPQDFPRLVDLRGRHPRLPARCPDDLDIEDACEIAPDGRRAAWERSGTVQLAGPVGSDRVELGPGCCPMWSPDGTRLAFVSGRSDAARLAVTRPDGSGKVVVPHEPQPTTSFAWQWSPTSDRIAFVANAAGKRQLWLATLDGAAPRSVTDEPTGIADASVGGFWTPTGRWLLYPVSPAPRSLVAVVARIDGADRHVVVRWRTRGNARGSFFADAFFSLTWSRGDRAVAYHDLACVSRTAIFRSSVPDGRTRRLTNTCR